MFGLFKKKKYEKVAEELIVIFFAAIEKWPEFTPKKVLTKVLNLSETFSSQEIPSIVDQAFDLYDASKKSQFADQMFDDSIKPQEIYLIKYLILAVLIHQDGYDLTRPVPSLTERINFLIEKDLYVAYQKTIPSDERWSWT